MNESHNPTSTENKFEVGQVWSYKTREIDADNNSLLTILKTEQHPKFGSIAHIHLSNVSIPTQSVPTGERKTIYHIPISIKNLKRSVVELQSTTTTLPDYYDGYKTWHKAVDTDGAGVFNLDVAECVEYMIETLRSGTPQTNDG